MAFERETRLDGVLGAIARKLAKERDIKTAGDLLDFLPRRYLDASQSGLLSQFHEGEQVVLVATVAHVTTRPMRNRRGKMLTAVITDGDGDTASLVFFSVWGHEERLTPGARGVFRGKLDSFNGAWQLTHPDYSILGDDSEESVYRGGLVPIYLDVKGVNDMQISQCVRLVLDHLKGAKDPLPEQIRQQHGLVDELTAYELIHLPKDFGDIGRGKRRLRYDEALLVQLALAQRRAAYDGDTARARRATAGGLLAKFDERLPFELTAGQQTVSKEIADDLARERPMHRLLQGEVGSGKTIVALRAMLATVDAGAQAALLAPTEVLASQHARSISAMLGELGQAGMLGSTEDSTQVTLLTGSMTKAQRQQAMHDILNGSAGIVIGTHAIIQDKVAFYDLGLVVVDEQHRFGVHQRAALRDKAIDAPHVLVMTATPIPRTVAMTVFGDMDTSALTQLPKGRQPIVSHVVPAARPGWMERTWQRVAEEVRAGHQAYVVCPRIGDDADKKSKEPSTLSAVLDKPDELRANPDLAGLRIEMLHGRMTPDDKDAVMQDFNAGTIDVLVSTTVIEVGVDVPNATVMVILDADRFGISQLHQLRGRVGRGSAGGLCLLVTDTDSETSLSRLESVAATTDGFALADLDLELRSEGDVLGASQSGNRRQLRLLRLTHAKDVELIEMARADATELVANDPALQQVPALATLLAERLDDEQTEYLERS